MNTSSGDLLTNEESDGNLFANGTNTTMAIVEPCVVYFLLATVYLAALVFTATVLSLLVAAKVIPCVIRFVLANTLVASLIAGLGIFMINLATGIRTTIGHNPVMDNGSCRFLIVLYSVGGSSRPLVMAVFAIVVYIIIKYSISAVKLKYLVISVLVMWLVCGAFSLLLISPSIMQVVSTACVPHSGPHSYVYTAPFFVGFIILPFAVNIVLLIASFRYVTANTVSETAASLKPMLKFSVFLLLGTLLSTLDHTIPVIYMQTDTPTDLKVLMIVDWCISIVILLSIIAIPILILLHFEPVRVQMKRSLLHVCRNASKTSHRMSGQESLTESMLVSSI